MANILMVFASMTGNTEDIADAIAGGIREAGEELVVKSVLDTNAHELEAYEGIILGAYTWGDGDLPDEFLDFYEEMEEYSLSGKKAAVFGSCDSGYSRVGAAVDILIEKLREQGAEVVLDGLKIELSPSVEEKQQCKEYGRRFVEALR